MCIIGILDREKGRDGRKVVINIRKKVLSWRKSWVCRLKGRIDEKRYIFRFSFIKF